MPLIYKKRVWLLTILFLCNSLRAQFSEDLETLTALARVPLAISSNVVGMNRFKSRPNRFVILAADCVRLCNEALAVYNHNARHEIGIYDYCWGAYDCVNFATHLKQILKNDETSQVPDEIKKLESKVLALHCIFLPLAEGAAAILRSQSIDNSSEEKQFRNFCSATCSISRLLDNLIMSKPKSVEQYTYVVLIALNIFHAYFFGGGGPGGAGGAAAMHNSHGDPDDPNSPDVYEDNFFSGKSKTGANNEQEKTFFSANCPICLNDFKEKDKILKLGCGHCFCTDKICTKALDEKCAVCRTARIRSEDKPIIVTQDLLNKAEKE